MNLDFYTEEFRHFKYLKLDPELLHRFKNTRQYRNKVQNWHDTYDADFEWPHVVEFVEQVFDLRNDTLYIVTAGALSSKNEYEDANLIIVENPILLDSNPIIYEDYLEATLEDIPFLEDDLNSHGCLVDKNAFFDDDGVFRPDARIIRVNSLPIAPKKMVDFTAIFYNKDTAERYRKTLTEMLRHKINAISSFTSRL